MCTAPNCMGIYRSPEEKQLPKVTFHYWLRHLDGHEFCGKCARNKDGSMGEV